MFDSQHFIPLQFASYTVFFLRIYNASAFRWDCETICISSLRNFIVAEVRDWKSPCQRNIINDYSFSKIYFNKTKEKKRK